MIEGGVRASRTGGDQSQPRTQFSAPRSIDIEIHEVAVTGPAVPRIGSLRPFTKRWNTYSRVIKWDGAGRLNRMRSM